MKKLTNIIGSAKFAFIVTLLIILLSFLGSIITEKVILNLETSFLLSKIFNTETHELLHFAEKTGLLNIYTTPLFILLLFLFTLSIIICTIRLFPFAKKGFGFIPEENFENKRDTKYETNDFIDFFNKNGWTVSRCADNLELVKAEQHKAGKSGVIITHLGIILIMAGAIFGYIFGYNEMLILYENQKAAGVFSEKKEFIPFEFDIKLNSFNVEFYDGLPTAKAFLSNVTVLKNGVEEKNAVINTNHPLKYNNIVFYQSKYGYMPHDNMDIVLEITKDNKTIDRSAKYKKVFEHNGYNFQVYNFFFNYSYDLNTGKPFDNHDETYHLQNPAIYVKVYNKNNKFITGGWLLLKVSEPTYIPALNMSLKFKNLENITYSALSVKYNPGIYIVYLGGLLLSFGVIFIYFLNYTAVIFKVENGIIKYSIFSQRKYPLVNPYKIFIKFLDKEQ